MESDSANIAQMQQAVGPSGRSSAASAGVSCRGPAESMGTRNRSSRETILGMRMRKYGDSRRWSDPLDEKPTEDVEGVYTRKRLERGNGGRGIRRRRRRKGE